MGVTVRPWIGILAAVALAFIVFTGIGLLFALDEDDRMIAASAWPGYGATCKGNEAFGRTIRDNSASGGIVQGGGVAAERTIRKPGGP